MLAKLKSSGARAELNADRQPGRNQHEPESTMDAVSVYCSACEKEVHLASTPAPLHTGEANLGDEQLVCLTYGPRCPPEKCPLANLPTVVMGVRLARSGLDPEQAWRTRSLYCDGCGGVSEVEIVDESYAFCPVCGTTSRWAEA